MRVRVLGGCEIETAERKVALRFRQAELIGLLTVRRGRIARATAASMLWPDAEPSVARHNLRQTLVALRSGGVAVIGTEGESLVLESSEVDLWELEESLKGDFSPEPISELLPDIQSEWIVPVRAALVRNVIEACRRQAEGWMARYPSRALAYAELALTQDPWLESSHELKIRALLADGDRKKAEHSIFAFENALNLGSRSRLRELVQGDAPDPVLGLPLTKLSPNERVRFLVAFAPAAGSGLAERLEEAMAHAPALSPDDRSRAESMLSAAAYEEGDMARAECFARSATQNATEIGARSVATLMLARVLISSDRSVEAEPLLNDALADEDPERRSALLVARAAALARRHALAESERDSRTAITLAQSAGCLRLLAKARYNLASVALWAGKLELAQREAEAGLAEMEGRELGDPGALALILGRVLEAQGFWSKAAERYAQAVERMRASGANVRLAQGLTMAADLDRRRGNHEAAVGGYREAIVLYRTLGDRVGLATALKGWGQSLSAQGERTAAEVKLREALNAYLAAEEPLGGAGAMVPLARLLLGDGRAEEALFYARRALERLQALRADASGLTTDETLSVEAAQQLLEEIRKQLPKPGEP